MTRPFAFLGEGHPLSRFQYPEVDLSAGDQVRFLCAAAANFYRSARPDSGVSGLDSQRLLLLILLLRETFDQLPCRLEVPEQLERCLVEGVRAVFHLDVGQSCRHTLEGGRLQSLERLVSASNSAGLELTGDPSEGYDLVFFFRVSGQLS